MLESVARTRRVLTTEEEERLRILLAALAATEVSQSALADRLDVDFTSVNRWCNRWNAINVRTLRSALIALGLPQDWKPPVAEPAPPRADDA